MTSPQTIAPPSAQKMASRQAGLRRASLAILIVLIVQFALGISVNLYVTLPAAGHPGHSSWFGNGALLALHAALGMFLVLAALFVLVRAIMARNVTLIVTSAAGLVAIGLAFFFGASFTDKLTNGYSLGMAIAFAVALACYAIGLYVASTRRSVSSSQARWHKWCIRFSSPSTTPDRPLNRLSAAFRIFLVIPIAIVLSAISGYVVLTAPTHAWPRAGEARVPGCAR